MSDAVVKQRKVSSDFAVDDFFPPVALGETPIAMPPEIHFVTFVAALVETLEYRTERAQRDASGGLLLLRARSWKRCRGWWRYAYAVHIALWRRTR